ncbi:MAG: radical SAM protein, partial [Acidobacteriota bacterium]
MNPSQKRLKILLVQPAPFEPGRIGLENVIWLSEPVALTSIAGAVSPEHDVRILDMRLEEDTELNRVLLEFRPDLVGTTSMTTDCYQAKAVLEMAKATLGDQVFTIVGGHHPTLSPQDFEDEAVDAMCLGEGEETFRELIDHLAAGRSPFELFAINGLRFRDAFGDYLNTAKRSQKKNLDELPVPARHLLKPAYLKEYFFTFVSEMASINTSRGCSFDCNFCAIWEFYERKTRYMSAKAICDQLENIKEKFVFFLDDNFLTNRTRLTELCEEIERRGIKKYFATQGRSDFIANHPDVMRRLRDCGLMMVLSGYESNDDNSLESLRKSNTLDKNQRAAKIMRDLGMISIGVFMVRPEFEEHEFDLLYQTINEMAIAIPLVTILTPLPGTQMYKKMKDQLLTTDTRLFDLLHAVTPTRLPRDRFYQKYVEWHQATLKSTFKGGLAAVIRNPKFFLWDSLHGTW